MARWLAGLRVALRSIVRRTRVERELNEEIQYHLERQVDAGLKAGLSLEDARYAALRAMGAMGAIEKSKGNAATCEARTWSANSLPIFDTRDDRSAEARGSRCSPLASWRSGSARTRLSSASSTACC